MDRVSFRELAGDGADQSIRQLYEAALRLLGALGTAEAFPDDLAGVERLLTDVAEGRSGEVTDFAVEDPAGLPRFSGRHLIWVSPRQDGNVRLRPEGFGWSAASVVLSPDGRLSEFEIEEGFGVPDSELTAQALADREAVERLWREHEAESADSEVRLEEDQRRFRTEHLRGVSAAPWQDPEGLVVTWIAFYETGFIVSHLLPRAAEERSDREDDDPGEALWSAAIPSIRVTDDLGNEYEEVKIVQVDANWPLLRATREFGPAVHDGARRLIVRSTWGSVDIEVVP